MGLSGLTDSFGHEKAPRSVALLGLTLDVVVEPAVTVANPAGARNHGVAPDVNLTTNGGIAADDDAAADVSLAADDGVVTNSSVVSDDGFISDGGVA